MITIPLIEACIAMGGRSNKPIPSIAYIFDVTHNSKEIKEGSLFVALKGNKADGHDYIKEAEMRGAMAAVVEYFVEGIRIPQFIVPSTIEALGDLAKIWRGRLVIPVIAITGSVGKTTTKELIYEVLSSTYETHKSRKNFNNELGVPIELMHLHSNHKCSVIEFGMRNVNQINYLSKITRPNISVITNIGMSHIEKLKTRQNIANAKSEIFDGMDLTGISILNRDDEYFDYLSKSAKGKVITFGQNAESDVRIQNITLNSKANPSFRLNKDLIQMHNAVGKHHAYNAAIAYIIGLEMNVKKEEAISRIESFKSPERRGVISFAFNGARILDNSYNAAPDSIKASLDTIAHMHKMGNRTIVIIGEMLELGSHSIEAHQHIGNVIANIGGIDLLITVGMYSKYIGETSKVEYRKHFNNTNQVSDFLMDEIKPKDVILLQGSNKISLDKVVDRLEKGRISQRYIA
ncbi:UDP-N-acetylmuramoyl-tripeptide--D-alanyl-D-alanine ligase [Aquimarina sp. RZ0]|uniref:UDP-N-acetylmuramoyl-tripeptide--D-alanyl-D- alanine ligase n=1 Tax=Aquimarina sp. RZ0 TaxID=2607730 RepID=UPI0011F263A2|nr:UDP-N-acetylmuramoyl-tripeptide--D-alanyl-D-alanine ligase [Aquimarina sp. RZ0]KAA1243043.1 UDP-N-acetylmuramoyl-tripeptide--D-alanyl-D-alanine ligase [Aquimarina sp. RZ0]